MKLLRLGTITTRESDWVGVIFERVFEFILPMLSKGQYTVIASVADGNLYVNIQHHWMHGALIINVSSSKVQYGLVGISIEMAAIEFIHA